jgi:hypothetical protein
MGFREGHAVHCIRIPPPLRMGIEEPSGSHQTEGYQLHAKGGNEFLRSTTAGSVIVKQGEARRNHLLRLVRWCTVETSTHQLALEGAKGGTPGGSETDPGR